MEGCALIFGLRTVFRNKSIRRSGGGSTGHFLGARYILPFGSYRFIYYLSVRSVQADPLEFRLFISPFLIQDTGKGRLSG